MATNREVLEGFDFLDNFPRYRRVDANTLMMSNAIHAETRPLNLEVIREIFNRLKHQFAVNNDYEQAYQTFFERHPEYKLDANMTLLDRALVSLGEDVTVEHLEELLLPGNPRNVLDQLAITAEAVQAQFEAREIERMISEITAYMLDTNGKVKREFTQRQYNEKIAGLRAMPFSELSKRYDEVMTARGLRKTSVEALRAVVKTDAVRQRQTIYQRYEPLPDQYFPPGKSVGLNWSAELFRRLPTSEQRRLLDHFGDAQLTAAINAAGRN